MKRVTFTNTFEFIETEIEGNAATQLDFLVKCGKKPATACNAQMLDYFPSDGGGGMLVLGDLPRVYFIREQNGAWDQRLWDDKLWPKGTRLVVHDHKVEVED